MVLMELIAVYKHYQLGDIRIQALDNVDLRIEEGEYIAVWGPSGSGKSTLCNILALIDDCSSGTVLFKGHKTKKLTDNQRSDVRISQIGIIFQGFNLIPVLSALENVMLPLQVQSKPINLVKKRALSLLDTMRLSNYRNHRPDQLSGGQQQRVAIARALINHPSLVIADEPTANLDTENAESIIDLMHEYNRKEGTTFIFSTHDQRLLNHVDRRIHLKDGEINEDITN